MNAIFAALLQRWRALAPRERRAIALAVTVLALALLWIVLLRPALRTLRQAPGQIEVLQQQLREVHRQADELARLKSAPAVPTPDIDLRTTVADWMQQHAAEAKASVGVLPDGASLEVHAMRARTLLELAHIARSDWGAALTSVKLRRGADGFDGSVQLTRATPR